MRLVRRSLPRISASLRAWKCHLSACGQYKDVTHPHCETLTSKDFAIDDVGMSKVIQGQDGSPNHVLLGVWEDGEWTVLVFAVRAQEPFDELGYVTLPQLIRRAVLLTDLISRLWRWL